MNTTPHPFDNITVAFLVGSLALLTTAHGLRATTPKASFDALFTKLAEVEALFKSLDAVPHGFAATEGGV